MAMMVGLGEVLWDVFPDKRLLGGAPANFAFHAHQLGHHGVVVSRVGTDPMGREVLDRLKGHGLTTEYVQVDPARPTGTVTVTVAQDGSPNFVITRDVAWDHLALEPALVELIGRAEAICFGTLAQRGPTSRATIETLLASAGGMKIFDINLRQDFWSKELIEAGLRRSRVAKLNEDELNVLAQLGLLGAAKNPLGLCRTMLRKYDLKLVALTRASRGSMLVTPDEAIDHPGVKVNVVDGVGAGDAFAAAMAHALLRGKPLTDVAEFANRVGAYVATQPGATPTLPPELLQEWVG
jgi:fructokinase